MADELHYASGADTNKRKYDESAALTTPSPDGGGRRRPTGFSSPHAAPAGIDAAKQRAQEIASRLFNDAEAKRPKFDNGGYDSAPDIQSAPKPLATNAHVASTIPSFPDSYSYQGMTKKIDVPNGRVGVIIGKGGETIKYLQLQSGAKIQVTRDMDADPNSFTRTVDLVGTPDQIAKAEQLIGDVLAEAEAGGSAVVSRRVSGQVGSEQFSMTVPNNKVGLVIGKGGETIKSIQARSGARVQVIPLHPPPGDTSTERTVQIDGSAEQVEAAKLLVNEVISEGKVANVAGVSQYFLKSVRTAREILQWVVDILSKDTKRAPQQVGLLDPNKCSSNNSLDTAIPNRVHILDLNTLPLDLNILAILNKLVQGIPLVGTSRAQPQLSNNQPRELAMIIITNLHNSSNKHLVTIPITVTTSLQHLDIVLPNKATLKMHMVEATKHQLPQSGIVNHHQTLVINKAIITLHPTTAMQPSLLLMDTLLPMEPKVKQAKHPHPHHPKPLPWFSQDMRISLLLKEIMQQAMEHHHRFRGKSPLPIHWPMVKLNSHLRKDT